MYKSNVEYADYCLNHIEGCSHGCIYPCYAMMMKKRCGIVKNYQEWLKPKIVANALELLDVEIPKHKGKIKYIHLCFSTDPFMYQQPEVIDLTLKIIEKLNKGGIRCTALTKGVLPLDLKDTIKYSSSNEYGITAVSLDEKFRSKYEPHASTFKERIDSLKALHNAGLKTWISMEPYPTPNIINQNLITVLKEISFVDKIVFGRLNYNQLVSQYKNCKEFYNECSIIVSDFCKKNNIKYHIKKGTYTESTIEKRCQKSDSKIHSVLHMPDLFSQTLNLGI